MPTFGKIKSFDNHTGTGFIQPDSGERALPFNNREASNHAHRPRVGQTLSYDTLRPARFGKARAVDLRLQQTLREQAECQVG